MVKAKAGTVKSRSIKEARTRLPRALSAGEEAFALHCRAEGVKVEREYRFHPERMWRFDFALPAEKIGIEVEGLVRPMRGISRHTTNSGYRGDCEKYNAAVKLGWRVLRFSTDMVIRGDAISDVLEMLGV